MVEVCSSISILSSSWTLFQKVNMFCNTPPLLDTKMQSWEKSSSLPDKVRRTNQKHPLPSLHAVIELYWSKKNSKKIQIEPVKRIEGTLKHKSKQTTQLENAAKKQYTLW